MTPLEYVNKYKKTLIIATAILILVFLAIRAVTSYALVSVEVTSATNTKLTGVTIYSSTDSSNDNLGAPGLKIVARSTKSLVVKTSNNVSTQTSIDIPWFGYAQKTITVTLSKNADKIAYKNTGFSACATYSVRTASLLSYDCKKPRSLTRYQTSRTIWSNDKLADLYFQDNLLAPYMGGLIGIEAATDKETGGPVVVVGDNGRRSYYDLPDGKQPSDMKLAHIVTNELTTTDNRFVLTDQDGVIYLGKPSGQTVEYKTIAPPNNYSSLYQQTLCRILNDLVYCYRGQRLRGDLPSSEIKLPAESLVTASFTNDQVSSAELDTPGRYSDFYVTSEGDFYGKNFKKLFHIKKSSANYTSSEIAQNIDAAAGGNGLFYIQQNSLYHIKKVGQDAIMVFYSPNIFPQSIYISENNIFFISKINRMGDVFYAYKLNDQDNTSLNRTIDLLPAGGGQLPGIVNQDLVGNKFNLTIAVSVRKNAKSTQTALDTNAIATEKQKILNAIKARGVDTDQLDVSFNY